MIAGRSPRTMKVWGPLLTSTERTGTDLATNDPAWLIRGSESLNERILQLHVFAVSVLRWPAHSIVERSRPSR